MKSSEPNHHVIRAALESIDHMQPLKQEKMPVIAAAMGAAFGPVGIGIYLQSWQDGFVSLGLWILCLMFAVPTEGAAMVLGPIFSAAYAYRRVKKSNAARALQH